ncbi:dynein light chain Tctex-type protein 2-like [Phymastichus coffea]|uniref:dynein light chain Tctex-type protein 2-like n=1 Tax=Phymastichus coffea TaxID=108790 RepID=UPI00273BA3A5|nr:dynein light chain Tctex-type protein 2-like [Phymastichus coffea]
MPTPLPTPPAPAELPDSDQPGPDAVQAPLAALHAPVDRSRPRPAGYQNSYQNSYRLRSDEPFEPEVVDRLVERTLKDSMQGLSYRSEESPGLCTSIAAQVQKRVQELKYDRCKVVVIVSIVEKASQSVQASLGFLWDSQRDRYSSCTFEAPTFVANCLVFGLYHE